MDYHRNLVKISIPANNDSVNFNSIPRQQKDIDDDDDGIKRIQTKMFSYNLQKNCQPNSMQLVNENIQQDNRNFEINYIPSICANISTDHYCSMHYRCCCCLHACNCSSMTTTKTLLAPTSLESVTDQESSSSAPKHWQNTMNRFFQQLDYESGFYEFLGRFSGRRRCLIQNMQKIVPAFTSFLILLSLFSATEACSSRTTPKPRPPPTPAPRPSITFHTYKCPPTYAAWYCLNEATCFTVKIGDEILYNCECADGYMGPRCEYKDLDGSYLPTRPRVMLETASIYSGAALAMIFALIICLTLYVHRHRRQKLERLAEENGDVAATNGVDTVDGIIHTVRCEHLERRPFGPHHYYTIPMAATLKR